MTDHLAMALRNEELSVRLYDEGEFYEWVVVTSFYSALHWMHHIVFPHERLASSGKSMLINDLKKFHQEFRKEPRGRRSSRHQALLEAVIEQHPAVRTPYGNLLGESMTARYDDHRFSKAEAKHARKQLDIISKYSRQLKPIPPSTP